MKHIKFLLLLVCTGFFCCDKEDPNAAKLSAKVDGQYWEDELPKQLKARIQNGQIIVVSPVCGFQLYMTGLTTGTYPLGRNHSSFGWTKAFDCNVLSHSNINEDDTGQAEITAIDREKSTVSGRFSYTAIHLATGKKVQVTEGEFLNIPYTEAAVQGIFEELSLEQAGRTKVFTETDNFKTGGTYYIEGKHPETDDLKIEIPSIFGIGTHDVEGDYTANNGLLQKIKFRYVKSGKTYNYLKPGSKVTLETLNDFGDLIEGSFEVEMATSNAMNAASVVFKGRFKGNVN